LIGKLGKNFFKVQNVERMPNVQERGIFSAKSHDPLYPRTFSYYQQMASYLFPPKAVL
jgi:hypothetical protein